MDAGRMGGVTTVVDLQGRKSDPENLSLTLGIENPEARTPPPKKQIPDQNQGRVAMCPFGIPFTTPRSLKSTYYPYVESNYSSFQDSHLGPSTKMNMLREKIIKRVTIGSIKNHISYIHMERGPREGGGG
jgi:hypothetical protein